ncbi:uncharacterized protein LOC109134597 [Beta vulgaris subsp. vulgaris]|uniref:uncharacterized protein LOC109134597 n=1 Tax=Beta vulgaris subsp. vulgaris TaxID=3555 RepID=UPI002036A317|nr:uncharacterized protein LOC109134597 [Beta vulgaris subsp. vulgaris]
MFYHLIQTHTQTRLFSQNFLSLNCLLFAKPAKHVPPPLNCIEGNSRNRRPARGDTNHLPALTQTTLCQRNELHYFLCRASSRPVQVIMSNPKGRGGRDGIGESQGRGNLIPMELFESPGAPESQNHISETEGDDSQARNFGNHVPETPKIHGEEGEGSNRAPKKVLSPTGLW